jgi:hypothetical protein
MVVKTQCKGREVIGLHVGTANARRYFSRQIRSVELHLGDLQIECALTPDFWLDQPEIRDPRLCEWLKFKLFYDLSGRMPATMAMVQFGMNSFKLLPASMENDLSIPSAVRYSSAA